MNRSIFTGLTLVAAIAGCDGASDNTQAAPAKEAPAAAEDQGDTLATVNGLSVGSKEFEAAAAFARVEEQAAPIHEILA